LFVAGTFGVGVGGSELIEGNAFADKLDGLEAPMTGLPLKVDEAVSEENRQWHHLSFLCLFCQSLRLTCEIT